MSSLKPCDAFLSAIFQLTLQEDRNSSSALAFRGLCGLFLRYILQHRCIVAKRRHIPAAPHTATEWGLQGLP
jgi:hypothetical protein